MGNEESIMSGAQQNGAGSTGPPGVKHHELAQHPVEPMLDACFERLLEHLDPHGPQCEADVQLARILCGRWLVWRRLISGHALDQLADQTGIAPQTLMFLETGLADQTLATEDAWLRLAGALATDYSEIGWVRTVLAIALNRTRALSKYVMMRVAADLRAGYAPGRAA